MAATFPFKLITPTGVVFDGPVEEVSAIGPLGQFGVLAEHINFITSLVPGVLEVKLGDGSYRRFVVFGGLAEVKDGEMTLLAPEAQEAASVDRAAARSEVEGAENKLGALSFYDPAYEDTERALQLARAKQRAAELGAAR